MKKEECENELTNQSNLLDSYISDAELRFDTWAVSEAEQIDEWIAQCEEAWQWILKSYCLDDEYENDGHGCGYGYGNTHEHFEKNAPINDHATILSAG